MAGARGAFGFDGPDCGDGPEDGEDGLVPFRISIFPFCPTRRRTQPPPAIVPERDPVDTLPFIVTAGSELIRPNVVPAETLYPIPSGMLTRIGPNVVLNEIGWQRDGRASTTTGPF